MVFVKNYGCLKTKSTLLKLHFFNMEIDTPIFQGQRKQLCEHLFSKGYAKEQVLEAMMRVPRHIF